MSIKNAQDIVPMKWGLKTKRVTQTQKNFKDSILILSNELETHLLTKKKKDAASVDLTSELMAMNASSDPEKQSEGIAGTFIDTTRIPRKVQDTKQQDIKSDSSKAPMLEVIVSDASIASMESAIVVSNKRKPDSPDEIMEPDEKVARLCAKLM